MLISEFKFHYVSEFQIDFQDAKPIQYDRLPSVEDNKHLEYFIDAVSSMLKFELRETNTNQFIVNVQKDRVEFLVKDPSGIIKCKLVYQSFGKYSPSRNHERKRGLTQAEQAEFSCLAQLIRCAGTVDPYFEFRYKRMCMYATNEECAKATEISG